MKNKDSLKYIWFLKGLKELEIEDIINPQKLELFNIYLEELKKWNEKFNLTAITNDEEIFIKHFLDSLQVVRAVSKDTLEDKNLKIIDLGAGAGFPSVPLKIIFEKTGLLLVDSLKKRTVFLEHLKSILKLQNTEILWERGEVLARDKKYRETFDILLARSVSKTKILIEIALPLVKVGGKLIFYKGYEDIKSLPEHCDLLKKLGGNIESTISYTLPIFNMERYLVIIKKVKHTPSEFPRTFKEILK